MSHTTVQVTVRIRPALEEEEYNERLIRWRDRTLELPTHGKSFIFDSLIADSSVDVYSVVCRDLVVDTFFEGYNATILAYGQTGSGKTYTMGTSDLNRGLLPEAFRHIFSSTLPPDSVLSCNFLEIYNEDLHDLLSDEEAANCGPIVEDPTTRQIIVLNLIEDVVFCEDDLLNCLIRGANLRHVGSHALNKESSRSHAIFTINLVSTRDSETGKDTRQSKFNFVDLAGSERAKRTGATGHRMREGIHINSGLLALGVVIHTLTEESVDRSFVPYRQSKLTRILQDSLGGNARTRLIACISPCSSDLAETYNTLKYASRAQHIKNTPIVNRTGPDAEICSLKERIRHLEQEVHDLKNPKDFPTSPIFEALQTKDSARDEILEEEEEKKILSEIEEFDLGKELQLSEEIEAGENEVKSTKETVERYLVILQGFERRVEQLQKKLNETEVEKKRLEEKVNVTGTDTEAHKRLDKSRLQLDVTRSRTQALLSEQEFLKRKYEKALQQMKMIEKTLKEKKTEFTRMMKQRKDQVDRYRTLLRQKDLILKQTAREKEKQKQMSEKERDQQKKKVQSLQRRHRVLEQKLQQAVDTGRETKSETRSLLEFLKTAVRTRVHKISIERSQRRVRQLREDPTKTSTLQVELQELSKLMEKDRKTPELQFFSFTNNKQRDIAFTNVLVDELVQMELTKKQRRRRRTEILVPDLDEELSDLREIQCDWQREQIIKLENKICELRDSLRVTNREKNLYLEHASQLEREIGDLQKDRTELMAELETRNVRSVSGRRRDVFERLQLDSDVRTQGRNFLEQLTGRRRLNSERLKRRNLCENERLENSRDADKTLKIENFVRSKCLDIKLRDDRVFFSGKDYLKITSSDFREIQEFELESDFSDLQVFENTVSGLSKNKFLLFDLRESRVCLKLEKVSSYCFVHFSQEFLLCSKENSVVLYDLRNPDREIASTEIEVRKVLANERGGLVISNSELSSVLSPDLDITRLASVPSYDFVKSLPNLSCSSFLLLAKNRSLFISRLPSAACFDLETRETELENQVQDIVLWDELRVLVVSEQDVALHEVDERSLETKLLRKVRHERISAVARCGDRLLSVNDDLSLELF